MTTLTNAACLRSVASRTRSPNSAVWQHSNPWLGTFGGSGSGMESKTRCPCANAGIANMATARTAQYFSDFIEIPLLREATWTAPHLVAARSRRHRLLTHKSVEGVTCRRHATADDR